MLPAYPYTFLQLANMSTIVLLPQQYATTHHLIFHASPVGYVLQLRHARGLHAGVSAGPAAEPEHGGCGVKLPSADLQGR